jgi:signal peptidase I
MLWKLIEFASLLALPVALVCVIDDWFLRTGRLLKATTGVGEAPASAVDPVWLRVLYAALPVLVLCGVARLLVAERIDFSLVLVLITAASGLVWAVDTLWVRRRRREAIAAAGRDPSRIAEPGTVDYARSFFPVAAVLLVLRSFVFEPYRIPSDSMMPTLLDGDFIVVSKSAYGLRWPALNRKFAGNGAPARGDVAVFRFPRDPSTNYIKRVVGLPGDRVQVRGDRLIINGEPVPFREIERYDDGCYLNMRIAEERLGERTHRVLHCASSDPIGVPALPGCNRAIDSNYVCSENTLGAAQPDFGDTAELQVPAGQYLMLGDNRDNSQDGRYWGFVDETLLVGRATRIWFNWDMQRSGGPNWSRIGQRIE